LQLSGYTGTQKFRAIKPEVKKMNCRTKLLAVLLCTFLSKSYAATSQNPSIADRLVVEVDNKAFTQREIEIHFLCSCLMRQLAEKNCIIDSANWMDVTKLFTDDMIIRQQAGSMVVQQAPTKAIDKASDDVLKKINASPPLIALRDRLQITPKDIRRAINEIFGIEVFKQRKMQLEKSGNRSPEHTTADTKKRVLVRQFADTDKYVPLSLQPNPSN
jgi:hypothetical protein